MRTQLLSGFWLMGNIKLADAGHTIVFIEHNLDVIKTADYLIDIGPEAGKRRSFLAAAGPEEVAEVSGLHSQFLKENLTLPSAVNSSSIISRKSLAALSNNALVPPEV